MDDGANPIQPERIEILGVPVNAVTMQTALAQVMSMLSGNETNTILAVNPEKVIAAHRDQTLLQTLRNAALVIPDGIGVVLAARFLQKARIERVPGSELMPEICRLAAGTGHRIFLFGAQPEVILRASLLLQESYPGLNIVGTQHGYVAEKDMDGLINTINASGADILFVGLGSPRQELWMERYRHQLKVKVCQGVGGTFDAICGNPKRAPLVFRKLHLEWFYRLVSQPKRAIRQVALPLFAMQVVRQAILGKTTTADRG